ncbi:MAG: LLM class flavin-dependent oxidoreductase [Thermomicrobiales bacterium]
MVQLSVGLPGNRPLGDYLALARLAEDYGFHTLSIFDDLLFKPAWPILFTIAGQTSRIRLGPSVANPYLIHPAILAEYAALLDEATGGRTYFGIGRGAFLDSVNTATPRPLTAVREAIELARHLLRGDTAPYTGQIFQTTPGTRLTWQPPRHTIPIMVGTWGPRMARMAGGLADEVKAGSCWSAPYGRMLRDEIDAGARAANRDPSQVQLVLGPLTAISDDRAAAQAHARRTLTFYLPYLAPMPAFAGLDPELLARINAATAQGNIDHAAALISDDHLDQFALYGTPHDCIAGIERLVAETGVGRVEFGAPHSPDGPATAIHLLGKHVIPHFRHGWT